MIALLMVMLCSAATGLNVYVLCQGDGGQWSAALVGVNSMLALYWLWVSIEERR